jgi:hypothetical protein
MLAPGHGNEGCRGSRVVQASGEVGVKQKAGGIGIEERHSSFGVWQVVMSVAHFPGEPWQ